MCDSKMFKPVQKKPAPLRAKRDANEDNKHPALDGEMDNNSEALAEKKEEEDECKDVNVRLDRRTGEQGEVYFNTRLALLLLLLLML